jgi:hypothetical protein
MTREVSIVTKLDHDPGDEDRSVNEYCENCDDPFNVRQVRGHCPQARAVHAGRSKHKNRAMSEGNLLAGPPYSQAHDLNGVVHKTGWTHKCVQLCDRADIVSWRDTADAVTCPACALVLIPGDQTDDECHESITLQVSDTAGCCPSLSSIDDELAK